MTSLVGQQLGPYTVLAQMGSGGMATVYRAHHPRLDRDVAIKMLHEAFQQDQNFLARFEREAQIVARLEHPHIVPVFDFDEFNGRPYLVMKYIEGRTLKAVLDERALTLDAILRLLPPIADALDYAHGQGVLHRDIKPSNIIIDSKDVPYLTDFGLARMAQLGDSTLSQDVLLGTPNYISPEQAMGNRELDSRTDLYSLGVVLYELVVGRVPFSADTPFAIIHDHIYRPLPVPSSVNPEITPAIDAVLEKALAKAPADRYASATEMVNAFRAAVDASGVHMLNPNRRIIASESLAKLRSQTDDTPSTMNLPVEKPASAPQAEPPRKTAPLADENIDWEPEEPRKAAHQRPPRPSFPAMPGAPHPPHPRQIIEASFDLNNAGRALGNAGDVVRDAIEGISAAFDREADLDLAPLDDREAIRRRVEYQFKKRNEFLGHLIAYVLVNTMLWVIYGSGFLSNIGDANFNAIMGFPWPMIVMFGWGAGLAAHAVETFFVTGRRASRRLRAIHAELQSTFGDDWMYAERKELRSVRTRVSKAFDKRREFFQHFVVYVLINLMLWGIWGGSSVFTGGLGDALRSISFPWPLLVTLGWGIGLVANAVEALTASSRESAISRAVERERARLYDSEKPKNDRRRGRRSRRRGAVDDSFAQPLPERDESQVRGEPHVRGEQHVRLTEDGEFTDSMVEEMEEKPKRSRQ